MTGEECAACRLAAEEIISGAGNEFIDADVAYGIIHAKVHPSRLRRVSVADGGEMEVRGGGAG